MQVFCALSETRMWKTSSHLITFLIIWPWKKRRSPRQSHWKHCHPWRSCGSTFARLSTCSLERLRHRNHGTTIGYSLTYRTPQGHREQWNKGHYLRPNWFRLWCNYDRLFPGRKTWNTRWIQPAFPFHCDWKRQKPTRLKGGLQDCLVVRTS